MRKWRFSRGFAARSRWLRKLSLLGAGFTCLLLSSISASPQERPRRTLPPKPTAEREIRRVIDAWARAVKNRDQESLDRLFADDLFITDYNGGTRGKRQELEILKPSSTTQTISVTNENLRVRTFPKSNVAVVTAIVRMVFRTSGRDSPFAMRYTSLWEKRSGRWQLTVLQTTRLGAT